MRAIHAFSILALLAPVLHSQSKQSWNNLATLHAGQTVQVKSTHAETWKGAFVAFTEDSIAIRVKGRDLGVPRTEVKSVKVKSAMVRLRHTLIGAGIGAAAGTAIAVPNINEGYASYTAVAAAVGTLVGATVCGAVLPAYSTVYQAGP